jgi:hypothetical protein
MFWGVVGLVRKLCKADASAGDDDALGGVSIKLFPYTICCPDDFYTPSNICVLDLCRGGLLIGGQF